MGRTIMDVPLDELEKTNSYEEFLELLSQYTDIEAVKDVLAELNEKDSKELLNGL